VIDVLERIDEAGGCSRPILEEEYGSRTINTLLEAGLLTDA